MRYETRLQIIRISSSRLTERTRTARSRARDTATLNRCSYRSIVSAVLLAELAAESRVMLAAPILGAARRRALAPTGHRAAACDQHDTRRHDGDIDDADVAAAAGGVQRPAGAACWPPSPIPF